MLSSELFIGYVEYLKRLRRNFLLYPYDKQDLTSSKTNKGDEYETIQLQTYVCQLYCS